uniref:Mitochondrial calcium uptake 2 n=1 Tax=Paramormyrops kingsleyae TaxID=1676925 RepID=A0A3B3SUD0_9TELE
MANWSKLFVAFGRCLNRSRAIKNSAFIRHPCVVGSVIVAGGLVYQHFGPLPMSRPYIVLADELKTVRESANSVQSARRLRFSQFSSVVYDQEVYMTPRDFLFSVMLDDVDLDKMLTIASKAQAGKSLFRTIGDNGKFFMLTAFTLCLEPDTGFHIAFKMLDVDGNEHVDKKEFLTLKNIIGKREKVSRVEAEVSNVNTTLQVFFFGKAGRQKLHYKEFCRFMEDLQAEVQEMEFLQFSKGMETMRREDFAEWLLHYTNEEDNRAYWENVRKKIPAGQSITFDEFKSFCLFTNNLEDFAFSVKMISEANRPIGIAQFKRAVKIATGHDLSESVVDTVFKIFDLDGDNCLSRKEFLGVMNDRILRGLKVKSQHGIPGYWRCVKQETLKGAQEALKETGSPF